MHNKTYLKINIKEDSQCICKSVILIDSVYRKDKNCYPQVFLEYNFNDNIEISSDEEYSEDSDDSNEKIQINKIPTKKI